MLKNKKILVIGIMFIFVVMSFIPMSAGDKVQKTTTNYEIMTDYIRFDDFEDYDVGEIPKSERGWTTEGVNSNQYCEARVDPLDSSNMVMLIHGSSANPSLYCELIQENFSSTGSYSIHYRIYTPQLSMDKTVYEYIKENPYPSLVNIHRRTGQIRWGSDSYCGGYYEFDPQINPSTSRWIEEEIRVDTDELWLWHDQSTDASGGFCNDPIEGMNTWIITVYPVTTQSIYIDDFWITDYNLPPEVPFDPDPSDGAIDVDVNSDLSWNCSDGDGGNVTFDVYFGDSNPPPLVSSGQSEKYYIPDTMDYETEYFWQIIARDDFGTSAKSPIWDFTTGVEPNDPPETPSSPNPEDGGMDIDPATDLSWVCSDPDGDDLTYYIYFGDHTPPPLVASGYPDTTYNLGIINYDTKYYWKINAEDEHGAFTPGPIWSFTTVDIDPPDIPVINGPHNGNPGKSYTYTFVSDEPNDDDVYYQINWGDGTFEDWFGPFESNEIVTKEHKWDNQGNYTIMARGKDPHDNIGDWGTFSVSITKNKALQKTLFLQLLERFPVLQLFLQRLVIQ